MKSYTIDLSWLCLALCIPAFLIGIFFIARLRFKAGLREYQRYKEAQSRGAFSAMNTPKQIFKFRWLAILALLCLLGMLVSLGILVLNLFGLLRVTPVIAISIFALSAIPSSIFVLLMYREFVRRL